MVVARWPHKAEWVLPGGILKPLTDFYLSMVFLVDTSDYTVAYVFCTKLSVVGSQCGAHFKYPFCGQR